MPVAQFPQSAQHQMSTPLLGVMQSGESLKHFVDRHLAANGGGLVTDVVVTPSVVYASVQVGDQIEAKVFPYQVDYRQPAPREVRYGEYSERDNPQWAYAPPRIMNRLSPTDDATAATWRSRCWAHQLMLRQASEALQPGDVMHVVEQKVTAGGMLAPGFYALVKVKDGYGLVKPLDGDAKSIVVPNVTASMVKVPLTNDPRERLKHFPMVVNFSLTNIARDDERGSMYVLVGRTASGKRIPLAKADSGNYEALLKTVWELSKEREARMRAFRGDDLYQFSTGRGLVTPMLAQRAGEAVPMLDNLQVLVADTPEQLAEAKREASGALLDFDNPYDGPSM
ncbi:hypothetical protein ABDG87_005894 [Pseudomonas aeruginosa]